MTEKINIEKVMEEQGVYVSTTSGVSMYPMLRDRRDTIIVKPCKGRLNKYDVALYRRGDAYVLHRVIKVLPDSYIIRGDNCIAKEYGTVDADVLGRLVEFYRGEKKVDMSSWSYKAYSVIICALHPLVLLKFKFKALFAKLRSKKGSKQ